MTPALWGGLITFVVLMAGVIGFWMSPMGQRPAAQQEAQQRLVVCRSCGTQGHCTAKRVQRKNGIDGTKASAAILTGGTSILFTGPSERHASTRVHCRACNSTYYV